MHFEEASLLSKMPNNKIVQPDAEETKIKDNSEEHKAARILMGQKHPIQRTKYIEFSSDEDSTFEEVVKDSDGDSPKARTSQVKSKHSAKRTSKYEESSNEKNTSSEENYDEERESTCSEESSDEENTSRESNLSSDEGNTSSDGDSPKARTSQVKSNHSAKRTSKYEESSDEGKENKTIEISSGEDSGDSSWSETESEIFDGDSPKARTSQVKSNHSAKRTSKYEESFDEGKENKTIEISSGEDSGDSSWSETESEIFDGHRPKTRAGQVKSKRSTKRTPNYAESSDEGKENKTIEISSSEDSGDSSWSEPESVIFSPLSKYEKVVEKTRVEMMEFLKLIQVDEAKQDLLKALNEVKGKRKEKKEMGNKVDWKILPSLQLPSRSVNNKKFNYSEKALYKNAWHKALEEKV